MDRNRSGELLGRSAELMVVEEAIGDARAGVPSVLLVSGDAGIGKSALIEHAARRGDVTLILGHSAHIGGEVMPLAPVLDLLRQVRRSLAGDPAGVEAIIDLVGSGPGPLLSPLLELLGGSGGGAVKMIGVEDLQWADAATWDLFELVARNLLDEHIVWIGTYRENEPNVDVALRRRFAEFGRLPGVRRIHLGGLGRSDVSEQIATLVGEQASSTLVDGILTRGQGNPLFTEELVAAHLAGEDLPALLSSLFSADLTALPPATRSLLGIMATVGRNTGHEHLSNVADLDEQAVEAAMRPAIDARVVVVDPATDAFGFRHALIGEVVYAELLPSERKRLHRRVATVLVERTSTGGLRADEAGEVAFHLDRSGDHEAAFGALLVAADAAQSMAPAVAFRLLERALELWQSADAASKHENRSQRMWQAAELASGALNDHRAVDLAMAAFAMGPVPLGQAWGHERLGRYLSGAGRLELSAVEFEHAATLLDASDNGAAASETRAGLAQAELMLTHFTGAERWTQQVLQHAPAVSADRAAWAIAARVQGAIASGRGDVEGGEALLRHAIAAAPNAQARALATIYLGDAMAGAGDYTGAIAIARDGLADANRAGVKQSFTGRLAAQAAEALIRTGDWDEAAAMLDQHDGEGYDSGRLRICRAKALLEARRGDQDSSMSLLALAMARRTDAYHQLFLDATNAEVHLAFGKWGEAAEAALRGWDSTIAEAGSRAARFAMLYIEAVVEQSLDERARRLPDHAEAVRNSAITMLHRARRAVAPPTGSTAPGTQACLTQGVASLTRLGQPDPDAWATAAACWERLSDPWSSAVARLRESEAALSIGAASRAVESLQEAHRRASHIDAGPLLEQIAAFSRRARISVLTPRIVELDVQSIDHFGLTPREAEVLSLVTAGQTNREIGTRLYVSEKTAGVHVSNILRKLGVTSRIEAAAIAQRLGMH